ncbi:MAG: alpha/beta fold hydrolase [Pseudomonadota bacterium]
MTRSVFVLLHGMFHGGWCWSRAAEILRARGHVVTTPTQTGLGERAHLLSPEITLSTFVEDIVQHLRFDDLKDVTLVGHSFGGAVLAGVADRASERLSRLVYLDGAILDSGETWFSRLPADVARDRAALAQSTSGGVSLPPAPAAFFGIREPEDTAFVEPRLTPHPYRTITTAVTLENPLWCGVPTSYIRCTDPVFRNAAGSCEKARTLGVPVSELATGHDAMVTAPLALAEMLIRIAQDG